MPDGTQVHELRAPRFRKFYGAGKTHPRIVGAGNEHGRHAQRGFGHDAGWAKLLRVGGSDEHQTAHSATPVIQCAHCGQAAETVRDDKNLPRHPVQIANDARRPVHHVCIFPIALDDAHRTGDFTFEPRLPMIGTTAIQAGHNKDRVQGMPPRIDLPRNRFSRSSVPSLTARAASVGTARVACKAATQASSVDQLLLA